MTGPGDRALADGDETSPAPEGSTEPPPASGESLSLSARRQARERALALVYEADIRTESVAEVVERYPAPPHPFAARLAEGAATRRDETDQLLAKASRNWAVDRMPAIDRSILRIAIFELRERSEVSTAVVINEAVELAKRFSSEEAPGFVNGVLSSIAAVLRPTDRGGVALDGRPDTMDGDTDGRVGADDPNDGPDRRDSIGP